MMQQMYRGQVFHIKNCVGGDYLKGVHPVRVDFKVDGGRYQVLNPFVQLNYINYPRDLSHLQRRNLIQCISKSKFFNCIYREGAEDIDDGIYISSKFGKRPVVLNAERTHCYFMYKGRFYKSKVWTDKVGVVYGACAGSKYGEYDGKC